MRGLPFFFGILGGYYCIWLFEVVLDIMFYIISLSNKISDPSIILAFFSAHLLFAPPFFYLCQFCHIKSIHAMQMGVDSSRFLQIFMISLFGKFVQSLRANFYLDIDYFYKSFLQSEIYNLFVLEGRDRTITIYYDPSHLCTINGS